MFEDEIIASLLDCMEQAIKRGDWSVDGACDPDSAMWQAEKFLKEHGWTRNAIDNRWQNCA